MPDWQRSRCLICGSFSYARLPDASELNAVYAAEWSDNRQLGNMATGSTTEAMSRSLLKAVGWNPDASGACLDYGGGQGLMAASLAGQCDDDVWVYEPYGTAASDGSVSWATEFEQLPTKHFDWIFMVEVIEHMLDPVAELSRVRALLRPGGRLVITTPNARGLRARLDRFQWREAQNPTHIHLFSASALCACLHSAGFDRQQRNYGPVRYLATGPRAAVLYLLQRIGIDGGLRYVANIGG